VVSIEVDVMLLGHGKVYGAQYYTVAPPMGGTPWRDMEAWCQATFGASTGSIWSAWQESSERWYVNNSKFWFRDEADRAWFLLRWS
jgi:hypothetical protein